MKIEIGKWSLVVVLFTKNIVLRLVKWFVIVCVAIVLGFTLYAVTMLPDLRPWHTTRLNEEFTALQDSKLDFDGYLKLEEKLFAQMDAEIATWDHSKLDFIYSRFNADGPLQKLADGAPYNRSYRMTLPNPVGHALLIHGLTDSPYSMKAMAESLHNRGFDVTVLRLPGHGTLPSMMTEMSAADWTAAVRLAARDVASKTPTGQPFYIGGHSTGGTLALQYALDALEDASLRRPDRVLLLSPAVEITEVADVAAIIDALSFIPIPVLEKVRWQDVVAEYDPYKFNSFPVNATRQVNRASKKLRKSLLAAKESGRITNMPPVVTWQSVVDATVGAQGATNILYPELKGAQHHLVLFDVNHSPVFNSVDRAESEMLIQQLKQSARTYTLDLVSNNEETIPTVNITSWAPNNSKAVTNTDIIWPNDLVSVGHVALPFPPNDPVYGFMPGSGHNGIPSIGSWLLRGENGAISISLGSLTRVRSNLFWSLIDQEIGEFVAEDLKQK